jgi:hypothetical protein
MKKRRRAPHRPDQALDRDRGGGTAADSGLDNSIVMREVRSDFRWEGEMLRSPEFVVTKTTWEERHRTPETLSLQRLLGQ